jgi:hypothetical protein
MSRDHAKRLIGTCSLTTAEDRSGEFSCRSRTESNELRPSSPVFFDAYAHVQTMHM